MADTLDLCSPACTLSSQAGPENLIRNYHFLFIKRGSCTCQLSCGPLQLPPGSMIALNPGEPLDFVFSEHCEKFIVRIPEVRFVEVCIEQGLPKPRRIDFKQMPYKFAELGNLVQVLELLFQETDSGRVTPQRLKHYHYLLVDGLMNALAPSIKFSAPETQSGSFERIVNYIEDNLKRDISTEELANFAKMSLRSLYLLFEKNAKTTPRDFIRQKKLEQVYVTLSSPASKLANVTAVALEYGFNHLGRFSEFYKATYGLLPSESIKMRQMPGLYGTGKARSQFIRPKARPAIQLGGEGFKDRAPAGLGAAWR